MSSEEFLFLRPLSGEPAGEGGGWGLALRTVGMKRGIGRQLDMHQGNFNQPILTSSRKSSLTYPPLPRLGDDKCAQHERAVIGKSCGTMGSQRRGHRRPRQEKGRSFSGEQRAQVAAGWLFRETGIRKNGLISVDHCSTPVLRFSHFSSPP